MPFMLFYSTGIQLNELGIEIMAEINIANFKNAMTKANARH